MKKLILFLLPIATSLHAMEKQDEEKYYWQTSDSIGSPLGSPVRSPRQKRAIGMSIAKATPTRISHQEGLQSLRERTLKSRKNSPEHAVLDPFERYLASDDYINKRLDEASQFAVKIAKTNSDKTLIITLNTENAIQIWNTNFELIDPCVKLLKEEVKSVGFEFIQDKEQIIITTATITYYCHIINSETLKKIVNYHSYNTAIQKCVGPEYIATLDASGHIRRFTIAGDIINANINNNPAKSIMFNEQGKLLITRLDLCDNKHVSQDEHRNIKDTIECVNENNTLVARFDDNIQKLLLFAAKTEAYIASLEINAQVKSIRFFRSSDFIIVTKRDDSKQYVILKDLKLKPIIEKEKLKYAGYYVITGIVSEEIDVSKYAGKAEYKRKMEFIHQEKTADEKWRIQFLAWNCGDYCITISEPFPTPIEENLKEKPVWVCYNNIIIRGYDCYFNDNYMGTCVKDYDLVEYMSNTGEGLDDARSELLFKLREGPNRFVQTK